MYVGKEKVEYFNAVSRTRIPYFFTGLPTVR